MTAGPRELLGIRPLRAPRMRGSWVFVDNPEGSEELYERIRKQIDLDGPAGGILHIAGPSPNGGWRVIEVFESEEEAGQLLKERFGPALEALGFAGPGPQPQFWPVHNYMT